MRFTQIRNTYHFKSFAMRFKDGFVYWRHEGSTADQMEELSDGVKKDLSLYDECACQIKDNLIMFTGSSFNLTDYIMTCGSDQDVFFWNSYYPALLNVFNNKPCCHTVFTRFLVWKKKKNFFTLSHLGLFDYDENHNHFG